MTSGSIAGLLAGLVFFLLGMRFLSDGLRGLAGDRLRRLLTLATKRSGAALAFGAALGFIAHSGPASVMTVGFVNAGLLTLRRALPLLYGLNVGTSLSMQVISLPLDSFALGAVAAGGVCYLVGKRDWLTAAGRAVLGFGILFLGMKMMSQTMQAHRDWLTPVLTWIDGANLGHLLLGIVVSALLTVAVQSSGAMIGMVFVLIQSGTIKHLEQVYPIVLGAHIGTCVVGLLAAVGMSAEAKRTAYANLGFNIFNVTLAVLAAPLYREVLRWSSGDLLRQAANLHTMVMLVAAMLLVPFSTPIAAAVKRWLGSRKAEPPASFLDPGLLGTPEAALVAVIREAGRAATICNDSFTTVRAAPHEPDSRCRRLIRLNENAINEIKASARNYLMSLTRGYLSRRQALFVQGLDRCVVEIERIGDHIDALGARFFGDNDPPLAAWDEETREKTGRLLAATQEVLETLIASFDPRPSSHEELSLAILSRHGEYREIGERVKAAVRDRVANHDLAPSVGLTFAEIAAACDRIVRHCGVIALEERQPFFAIKPGKLPAENGGDRRGR